jgi:DNA-binding CsgD family transcriptional regulator
VDLIAGVAGLAPAEALSAVRTLVGRDVLAAVTASTFRLRQIRLRSSIYDHLDPVWRLAAHRRARRGLGRRDADPVELAVHMEQLVGEQTAEDRAILLAAARKALVTDPEKAARWLRVAAEGLNGVARQDVGVLLAMASSHAGRLVYSRDLLHDLLDTMVDRPVAVRAAAVVACARVERWLGHIPEAAGLLRRELELLDGARPPIEAVAVAVEYAQVSMMDSDMTGVREHLVAAERLARHQDDPVALAGVLAVRALGEARDGRTTDAVAAADECASLVDALSDRQLLDSVECLSTLGWSEVLLERFADASRHCARGTELARRSGRVSELPHLLVGAAQAAFWVGRLRTAVRLAVEAQEVAEQVGRRDVLGLAHAVQAVAAYSISGPDAAERSVEIARRAVRASLTRSGWSAHLCAAVMANAVLQSGDPRYAIDMLISLGGGQRLPELSPSLRPTWVRLLCTAAVLTGDLDGADTWAAEADRSARRLLLDGHRAFAEAAKGRVLLARGEPRAALRHFEVAIGLFRHQEMAGQEGVALLAAAQALVAAGRSGAADGLIRHARRLGHECGSPYLVSLVDDLAKPATDGAAELLGQLTPREREIAVMVGTGATTFSIARQLGISTHTVDAHLTRIYRKLGVPSRTGLAAMVGRRDVAV